LIDELGQMLEISSALLEAADSGDVDRVVALLRRRKELTDKMAQPGPGVPGIATGEAAELLRRIIEMDGKIEEKMRGLMGTLQKAIKAVQGEKNVVRGYLKQTETGEPKFLDKEG
jgi:hypothetical protein